MILNNLKAVLAGFVALAFAASGWAAGLPSDASTVAVNGGTASFVVGTTIPAVTVKGKSSALEGTVQVRPSDKGLELQHVEAVVPVATLNTGMSVRDQHMRKYIFTKGDGSTPDLKFSANGGACESGSDSAIVCHVPGELSIRGVARPFNIDLKVKETGSAFRVSGAAMVKLSDYGIEQPSQFGVKTANEVQIQLDFTGKQHEGTYHASASGVR